MHLVMRYVVEMTGSRRWIVAERRNLSLRLKPSLRPVKEEHAVQNGVRMKMGGVDRDSSIGMDRLGWKNWVSVVEVSTYFLFVSCLSVHV